MGWQAVAHGADAVLYWQWRPAANGQETYYGTVLGQDGKPNPIQPEIATFATELTGAASLLADTQPTAKVGMIYSYDSRWAIDLQRHHKDFDPIKAFTDFYRPLRVQSQRSEEHTSELQSLMRISYAVFCLKKKKKKNNKSKR